MATTGNTPQERLILRMEARKSWSLGLYLRTEVGTAIDVTAAVITLVVAKVASDGTPTPLINLTAFPVTPTVGHVRFQIQATDTALPTGEYATTITMRTSGYSIVLAKGVTEILPNTELAATGFAFGDAPDASNLEVWLQRRNVIKISAPPIYTDSAGPMVEGVSVATTNTLMQRDVAARAQVAAPAVALDIANKSYVDAVDTANKVYTDAGRPNPNLLINGDFRINQRGIASEAAAALGAYFFDRWARSYGTPPITWTDTDDTGRVLTLTHTTIRAIIERRNLPAGTYTLSWQGTATGQIYNDGGTLPVGTPSPITITLDGTSDVRVDLYGTFASATLSNVKLERGSVATPFQTTDYGEELRKCQRYYQRFVALQAQDIIGTGLQNSSTTGSILIPLSVPMRATPTVGYNGVYATDRTAWNVVITGLTNVFGGSGQASISVDITYAANGVQFRPVFIQLQNIGSSWIAFDAEL